MQIDASDIENGAVLLVRPRGKLDLESFPAIQNFFEGLWSRRKGARIVVDLSLADYVASSGWALLLSKRKIAREEGGDLALCGLVAEVERVYDNMRIHKLLPAAASVMLAARLVLGPNTSQA